MKAFGVSLEIWRLPEMFTVFRFKRRAHMFFLALYLCKSLKMISGWLQRLFLGKVISNLLVGGLQMEHLLFWQRLEIEVLTFQVLPTGKRRRQRTKYLRQLNFEPAKNFKLNPFLAVNFCKSVSDFLECNYDLPLAILFLIVLTAWSPGMRQFSKKLP